MVPSGSLLLANSGEVADPSRHDVIEEAAQNFDFVFAHCLLVIQKQEVDCTRFLSLKLDNVLIETNISLVG